MSNENVVPIPKPAAAPKQEQPRRFSLKKKVIKLELEFEDGTIHNCELRACSGDDRDAFIDLTSKRMKTDNQGNAIGMSSYAGIQPNLINKCLFDMTAGGEQVSQEEIGRWPGDVQTEIFLLAQQLSALDKEVKPELKKG